MSESTAGQRPSVTVRYEDDGELVETVTAPYWDPERLPAELDLAGATYSTAGFREHADGSVTVQVHRV